MGIGPLVHFYAQECTKGHVPPVHFFCEKE